MKSNELRIGNWVKGPLGELCKVTQLGHEKYPEYVSAEGAGFYGQNGFEPIPLTPEILEKAGFEREYAYYVIGCDTISICYSQNEGLYSTFILGYNKINNIRYLHQLQNFYFALTGEELNIQL